MTNTATTATEALPVETLVAKLTDWAWNVGEGTAHTDGLELLGIDEDEAVARYGEAGSNILCRQITADLEYRVAYRATYYQPEEGYAVGSVWIETWDGDFIAEAPFEGEDGLWQDTSGWWK